MKGLHVVAIAVLCMCLGLAAGRVSAPHAEVRKDGSGDEKSVRSKYRSTTRDVAHASDVARIGQLDGIPPEKYENKVLHLLALVENGLDFHNVDALLELRALMKGMSTLELSQALTDMEDIEVGRGRYDVYSILVSQLAKKDGIAALTYVMEQKGRINDDLLDGLRSIAFGDLAKSDPETAYEWYEANKDELKPRTAKHFISEIITSLAKKDLSAAFTRAENIDVKYQEDVFGDLGRIVAPHTEKREQFTDYLMTLNNDEIKLDAASSIIGQLVRVDSDEAIDYIEVWGEANHERLSTALVDRWVEIEPAKALDWQLSQEGGKDLLEDAFDDWAQEDPKLAEKWLGGQEDHAITDQLRRSAGRQAMRHKDFEQAVKWIDQMRGSEQRIDNLSNVYKSWVEYDEDRAQIWLESLREEESAEVIEANQ